MQSRLRVPLSHEAINDNKYITPIVVLEQRLARDLARLEQRREVLEADEAALKLWADTVNTMKKRPRPPASLMKKI